MHSIVSAYQTNPGDQTIPLEKFSFYGCVERWRQNKWVEGKNNYKKPLRI
jgi:hypothetical protein